MTSASATIPVGYKQTEIGVFPEDWDIKTLGEIGEVTGAGVDKKSNPGEQPVRLVNYVDVYNRRPITSNLLSHWVTTPANKANRCSVRKGDVFFTPTSEVREDIAVSSMALEDIPDAVYSYHLVRLRCNDEVEVAYRNHAFSAKYFLDQASVLADGSGTRYVVNLPNFRRMLVALPPQGEQRRIGTLLTDVETHITKLSELISKKTNIKQGTMQELLTGKTRLPGFSSEWETSKVKELVELKPSGIYGFEKKTDNLNQMPVATTAHISMTDKWNDKKMNNRFFTNQQVHDFTPKLGDLVVVKSSGSAASIQSGKMAYVNAENAGKFIFSNFLMLLRPIGCDTKYLFYQLTSSRVKSMIPFLVESSTYPNIRIEDYMDIEVPLPMSSEQEAIAEVLSDMDAEISALEKRLEKTKAIKQGILQELLTGKTCLVDPEFDMR